MLNNALCKILFEKRWMIFWWFIAAASVTFMMMQLFPTMSDLFDVTITEEMPAAMQAMFGDMDTLTTIEGYVGVQIFGDLAIIVVIFAVVFGGAIIAGEEKSGVLLTQLARPIKRHSIFFQKFIALTLAILVIVIGFTVGTFLGAITIGDSVSLSKFWQPALALFLLATGFGAITMMFGGLGIKGGGLITGFYAVVGYLLASMRDLSDTVSTLAHGTPFGFYSSQTFMTDGLDPSSTLWLIGFIILPILVGLIIFTKRDLRTT
ncbi:ABC transporter permease [Candidatus Saccharibacteria bacterium]|nr:ABC transporter permease [Candidatus Saccharibacteria bacterium]